MFKRFRKSEKGQGMVEYGLILALVSIVALGALGGIGGKVSDTFDKVVGGVSGGEVIQEEPIYTDDEIADLIDAGFIPVTNADELNNVRKNEELTYGKGTKWEDEYTSGLDKEYIQVADVDLSGYSEGEGWTPIGNDLASFKGTFDGNGYKITGLTIDKPETNFVGLFGYTSGATISNVGLENISVRGSWYVGGLVGKAYESTNISNSYATGEVTGSTNSLQVGGLVGMAEWDTTIRYSYATGKVTGDYYVGGLVGQAENESTISNSYATGKVTGDTSVGGLVGVASSNSHFPSTTISNSYAIGSVSGDYNAGGLVGEVVDTTTISNSYATGEVTGSEDVGGLVGKARGTGSSVTSSYWDTVTTGRDTSAGGTGKTTEEMKTKDTYTNWDFDAVWKIDEGNDYPKLR